MAISPEDKLIETLRRIEALHAGATTDGERVAAAEARKRILQRLEETRAADPPVLHKFTIADPWSRQVFNALARRYGLRPFRRSGQHQQTVMLEIGVRFKEQVFWPELGALHRELNRYLYEVTTRVIREALDASSNEADEVPAGQLPEGGS